MNLTRLRMMGVKSSEKLIRTVSHGWLEDCEAKLVSKGLEASKVTMRLYPEVVERISESLARLHTLESFSKGERRERSVCWDNLPAKEARRSIRWHLSRFLPHRTKEEFKRFCNDNFEIRL